MVRFKITSTRYMRICSRFPARGEPVSENEKPPCTVVFVENVIGIAITALLGIAGIASTHLLARSQRAADDNRLRAERNERYRFARHETVARLSGELVGELRALESVTFIRSTVSASVARKLRDIPDIAREDAKKATDLKFAEMLLNFAEKMDSDPEASDKFVRESLEKSRDANAQPPIPDTTAFLTKLSDLSAQLQIQGGSHVARAAERAYAAASATLFKLQAIEIGAYRESLDLEILTNAIEDFIAAAIVELRIKPHDKDANFDDLMERYKQETQMNKGQGTEKTSNPSL